MRVRALLAGVVVPIVLWVVLPVGSIAQPSVSTLQKKIDATEGRIGDKRSTEHVLTTQISGFNRRIDALQGRISSLSVRLTRLQADLDRKTAELQRLQSDLRYQRARQARLRARLIVGRRTLARRLLELYQSDRPDIVTVILNSNGFADLLEREEFISRISQQDRRIIDLVADAKRDATEQAARLAVLERRQRKVTAIVLGHRNEIAQVRDQLVGTRTGYERARQRRAAALASTRSQRHALEGRLDNLRAEQEKIRSALAASAGGFRSLPAGPIRGGGRLIWPVNGPITSPFCESRAWESCHPGVDIGVPSGTPPARRRSSPARRPRQSIWRRWPATR